MGKTITIGPVTRIEGHARITVHLDDQGQVSEGRFHVVEFRGFEKIAEGRPFWEMPALTARICGICPVSHILASVKACDQIVGIEPAPVVVKLRRLMHYAQILQSHALSFFHLSAPDLLLGFDEPASRRNVFGLVGADPELAREGIRLRQFGQEVIAAIGGRRIHPAWALPASARSGLSEEDRTRFVEALPETSRAVRRALDLFVERVLPAWPMETRTFGDFPSLFFGLVSESGGLEYYDGRIRIVGASGEEVAGGLDPARYAEYVAEAVEPWTYLKFPYYIPAGYPDGCYRVGPLARLNVARRAGTPLADLELGRLRSLAGPVVTGSFFYHHARLIEMLHCIERMEELLQDPEITQPLPEWRAVPYRPEGVGVIEAPRGTLVHHYRVDRSGAIRWVNLIVATAQNNQAMNRTVTQIARAFVRDGQLTEGILNRLEAGIRCYDPCLSCATHAWGHMPLVVELVGPDGTVLDRRGR